MSGTAAGLAARAAALRSAFDRSFVAPRRAAASVKEDFLAVRVGGEPYAMRLSEIAGLFVDRWVTPMPAQDAALIGVAGLRGAIVPVYSLPKLLGHPTTQAPRWLVLSAAAIAFAFEAFDGHLRVPAEVILPEQAEGAARGHAAEVIRGAGVVRPVLHLSAIAAALGTPDPPASGHNEE